MLALIVPILDSVLGSFILPFFKSWTDYKTTQLRTTESGFEAGANADTANLAIIEKAQAETNALKIQTFGLPVVRMMMWTAGGMSAIYFALIILDTILASQAFAGHAVLGVPKLPPPFDEQVWMIVQSVFLIQAVHVGSSNVTAWLGRK